MIQRQETKTMLCHTNVFISKDKQASLSYLVLTCVEYDDAEKSKIGIKEQQQFWKNNTH